MSNIQKMAVAAEAGVALNTINRYVKGRNVLRVSRAAIEAALKRFGWDSFIRPRDQA